MVNKNNATNFSEWKNRLHQIIFEENTDAGKVYNYFLLFTILASILVVTLESISSLNIRYGSMFEKAEWFFTIFFTIEYFIRLFCVRKPLKYALSFYGMVDFLSFIPFYLEMIIFGTGNLIFIRVLRMLRIFRLLKLSEYLYEADIMQKAIKASLKRIFVFLFAVITLVIIIGALIYAIEGPQNGFSDIPTGIYWAIVTITTVGYGDISPQTASGKLLASIVMLLGYGIIAVPTGIVSVEFGRVSKMKKITRICKSCGSNGNDPDAVYCKYCGNHL